MYSDADNRTGTGVAVLMKVQGMNRRMLAIILSIAMILCLVLPALVIFANHVKAANPDQVRKREVNELVTKKTVSPTEDPNVFDVQLEAYMTSKAIDFKPTDIVLVLDVSGSMTDKLSDSSYTNLNTHTLFNYKSFADVSHNSLFDVNNPYNSQGEITINDSYADNKYVEDPTHPGTFVYLAQTFNSAGFIEHSSYQIGDVRWDGKWYGIDWNNKYSYTFTTADGEIYESDVFSQNIASVGLDALFGGIVDGGIFPISERVNNTNKNQITFHKKDNPSETIVLEGFYYRSDLNGNRSDDYYSAEELAAIADTDHGGPGLWIKDDSGTFRQVFVDTETATATSGKGAGSTYVSNYTFWYEDEDGNPQPQPPLVLGNAIYGAKNNVFQGFKVYEKVIDSTTGQERYVVVHGNGTLESKSLYSGAPSEVSRLQTMKESVEDFIIAVHSNAYYRDIDQRIAVVKYSGDSSTVSTLVDVRDEMNTNRIIDLVYNQSASGATRIDRGMEEAKNMLGNRPGNERDRQSVVVAFTDGVPSSSNSYDTGVADTAIAHSRDMVRDYDTTVYSVGLFELADSDQMYGPMFYHSGLLSTNEICDGSVESKWGRTWLAQFVNSDMSDIDAAATNRFLNLLSSNYETANSVGLYKYNWFWDALTIRGGEGYRIERNFDKTGSGYYYGANNSQDLYEAFQKIAEEVAVPESTLGPETVLSDVIADSFKLVTTTPVEAYTMSYIGTGNTEADWDNESNWTSIPNSDRSLTVTTDGNTLSIGGDANTGFDYSSNYVNGQEVNDAGNHGKKTVMKFQIETIDKFVGGNQVPTNGDESGVYDSDGILVEDFIIPYKDIPLDYTLEVADQQIYYSQEADLTQLFTVPQFLDGKTNAYSSINYVVKDPDNNTVFEFFIPAGEDGSDGLYSLSGEDILAMFPDDLKENTTYTVQCVIEPINEGPIAPDSTRTGNGTVYVYKPVFYEKDDEISLAQGRAGVNLQPTVVWQLDDTTAPSNPDAQTETFYIRTDGTLVSTSDYQGDYSDLKYTLDNNDAPIYTTIDGTLPCITTIGTVDNKEVWISSRQGAPNITSAIDNTDENPAEKASPFNQYVMEETTNFQVVDVTIKKEANEFVTPITTDIVYYVRDSDGALIKASTYNGDSSELRKVLDGEGNPITYEEDGQTLYVYETVSVNEAVTRPRTDVRDDDQDLGSFTTYINTTSEPKTTANEGRFTISIKPVFDLIITKNFTGDYVNPENVTIVVTPQGDSTNARTILFTATDFTRNGVVFTATDSSIADLDSNQKYVISEEYDQGSRNANLFETAFTVTSDNEIYADDDLTDGYQFTLDKGLDEDTVTVVITNTLPNPTIEGIGSGIKVPHVLLYILAGVIVLGGGAGGMYVYKKKDEFIE